MPQANLCIYLGTTITRDVTGIVHFALARTTLDFVVSRLTRLARPRMAVNMSQNYNHRDTICTVEVTPGIPGESGVPPRYEDSVRTSQSAKNAQFIAFGGWPLKIADDRLRISASDVANFVACRHLSGWTMLIGSQRIMAGVYTALVVTASKD